MFKFIDVINILLVSLYAVNFSLPETLLLQIMIIK